MLKKLFVLLVVLALCLQTACASENVLEKEEEKTMTDISLYSLGNTSRLKEKMEKARSGEKTVVAYLGGSITEGLGVDNNDLCYAKLSYEYFAETYGTGDNVEYVNAGLSGTNSTLGMIRVGRQVLDYEPDIVFVEFAVNDGTDDTSKESYDSLVRTILSYKSNPAVVLIFTILESGYSAQDHMKQVGEYFELPMISVADALTPEFESGRMVWRDYSNDGSHPNQNGHQLICDFIANLYTKAEQSKSEAYQLKDGGAFDAPYAGMETLYFDETLVSIAEITDNGSFKKSWGAAGFPEGWKWDGGDKPLKFTAHASSVFIAFKRNNNSSMGSFDIYVNGHNKKTIFTSQDGGWGEAFTERAVWLFAPEDMEIEIRPTDASQGKEITIVAIGCVDNKK